LETVVTGELLFRQGRGDPSTFGRDEPMKKTLVTGLVILFWSGTAGYGADTHEGIIKEVIKAMNDMADILDGIKDRESARKAHPRLEKVVARLKELKKREGKLVKLSGVEEARLQEKYKTDLKKIHDRFFNAGKKLATLKLFDEVKDIFEQLQRLG
jgi:hypothetical protein